MKRFSKKMISVLLTLAILFSTSAFDIEAKSKLPSLEKSSVKVSVSKKATIKVKQVTKKTKVKIIATPKSKKIAKVSYSSSKKKLTVKGLKKGSTTVKIRFQVSKKKVTKKLKITVNEKVVLTEQTPTIIPVTPTAVPTTEPTPKPTPRPTPTVDDPYPGDDSMPIKDIYKDNFLVGAAINGSSVDTMSLKHRGMTDILKKHFNSTVLSNLMKPCHLLDENASKHSTDGMPVCKFDTCDEALQFCQDNGLKMRGHTLVWHNQTPEWFFHEDYDTSKNLVNQETMTKRLESYIRQVLEHCQKNYPGVIYCWDVVNECVCTDENSYVVTTGGWKLRTSTMTDNDFSHEEAVKNLWYETMGESYVEQAFVFARKYADPSVALFYNDYNVFQEEKRDNIYMMAEQLKKKGLIDGLGLQPTVGHNYPALDSNQEGSFKKCLEKYGKLGLEIQITELSFKIPAATRNYLQTQSSRYQEFMNLLLKEDSENGGPCNITSVTVFGICDDYPLYNGETKQNLYLWSKYCEPKLCFYGFIQPGLDQLAAKENK